MIRTSHVAETLPRPSPVRARSYPGPRKSKVNALDGAAPKLNRQFVYTESVCRHDVFQHSFRVYYVYTEGAIQGFEKTQEIAFV